MIPASVKLFIDHAEITSRQSCFHLSNPEKIEITKKNPKLVLLRKVLEIRWSYFVKERWVGFRAAFSRSGGTGSCIDGRRYIIFRNGYTLFFAAVPPFSLRAPPLLRRRHFPLELFFVQFSAVEILVWEGKREGKIRETAQQCIGLSIFFRIRNVVLFFWEECCIVVLNWRKKYFNIKS